MSDGSTAGRVLAGVGGVGSLLFGLVHFYWAAGGLVGVPAGVDAIGVRPAFLAYDIAAGVGFVAFAVIGVLLAAGSFRPRFRTVLVRVCMVGGVLAVLRGGVGVVQDFAQAGPLDAGVGYDVAFAAGGVIFLLAALLLRGSPAVSGARP